MAEISVYRVRSLSDILSVLSELSDVRPGPFWFRGQASSAWPLLPFVWREAAKVSLWPDVVFEQNLTNRFRARAALRMKEPPGSKDFSAWLSLMQHYGLPTRLLDWSRSPLVAAYFACDEGSNAANDEAAIWVLLPHRMNGVGLGSDLTYPIDADSVRKYIEPAFRRKDTTEGFVAVMAVEHDMRMLVQQGNFTIHSSRAPLERAKSAHEYIVKMLVTASDKHVIRRELRLLNVVRGDLFPDLANLAEELRGS